MESQPDENAPFELSFIRTSPVDGLTPAAGTAVLPESTYVTSIHFEFPQSQTCAERRGAPSAPAGPPFAPKKFELTIAAPLSREPGFRFGAK